MKHLNYIPSFFQKKKKLRRRSYPDSNRKFIFMSTLKSKVIDVTVILFLVKIIYFVHFYLLVRHILCLPYGRSNRKSNSKEQSSLADGTSNKDSQLSIAKTNGTAHSLLIT